MSKYIDAEKLKRLVGELKEQALRNHYDTWGIVPDALEEVEGFIDSLQQEQPDKVDFEDVWKTYYDNHLFLRSPMPSKRDIARHFYELGQQEMRRRITNPEYNAKVVERIKSEYPTIKKD